MIDADSIPRGAGLAGLGFIALALVGACTLILRGLYDASSSVGQLPFHAGIARIAPLFTLVGLVSLGVILWAWRTNHRRVPLVASVTAAVAAGCLMACASQLQYGAGCLSARGYCDAPIFSTTYQDAQTAVVASIVAAVGAVMLALVSLEDAIR